MSIPTGLNGINDIGARFTYGYIENLTTKDINTQKAKIGLLINPQLLCLTKTMENSFDISGCQIVGLKDSMKDLICDTVNNYCPYYCNCETGAMVRGLSPNNFNSSNNSFFHEEMLDDENFLNTDFSIMESDDELNQSAFKQLNVNSSMHTNFICKNLLNDEMLIKNNLKILSIDNIAKGKWILNGNISIEVPKNTILKNLKLYIYLGLNVVPSGEIDLGSYDISNSIMIKTFSFNLMFENELEGSELKIGLTPFGNGSEIKLLKTTGFFANKM